MTEEADPLKKLKTAANAIIKAGPIPFPLNDTIMEILKYYLDEEDLDFLRAFKINSSMSIEEVKKKLKIPEEEIERKAQKLAKKGFIFNQPNSKGVMVYRLLPLEVVGVFEYQFMQELPKDPAKLAEIEKVAKLFEKLMVEVTASVQGAYDNVLPMFEKQPPVDRTIPLFTNSENKTIEIEKEVQAGEQILPTQQVADIINKFEDIAVGNCFCRQFRKTVGHPCATNAPLDVCFTFGKSARHVVNQGFARKVSKEEALKILKKAEDAGLVHKAFHNGSDITKEENSICNCCKDCCDTFRFWRMGALPMVNSTNFLSQIKTEECTGCQICVEKCPMDAISMNVENKAQVNEKLCIGCGVCAHFCPSNAIKLKQGMRTVFIPPPRLKQ